jgi:hypothetical protein
MSAPEESKPKSAAQPGGSPTPSGTVRVSPPARDLSSARETAEPEIRIPTALPPPEPSPIIRPGRATPVQASTASAESNIGKPQLRSPDLKLEAAPAPPSRPGPALKAPRSVRSIWTVRFALLLGIALALGILYWSVFERLLPVNAEHRTRALEMTRLADEVEALRGRWTPAQKQEVRARYERAKQALFNPAHDLTDWQAQVLEQARMRVMEANVNLGPLQPLVSPEPGLSTITAQINVAPDSVLGSTTPSYARLLKFAQAVASSSKRLDLLELNVTGDSNSVSQAQAVVKLLATERGAQ